MWCKFYILTNIYLLIKLLPGKTILLWSVLELILVLFSTVVIATFAFQHPSSSHVPLLHFCIVFCSDIDLFCLRTQRRFISPASSATLSFFSLFFLLYFCCSSRAYIESTYIYGKFTGKINVFCIYGCGIKLYPNIFFYFIFFIAFYARDFSV